jgi:hypothetical protein
MEAEVDPIAGYIHNKPNIYPLALGARGHLPCGYMVGLWWVLSKFAQQIPSE